MLGFMRVVLGKYRRLIRLGNSMLVMGLLFASAASAEPELLVIGSAHFNNPGRDAVNIEVGNVMTAERQLQMQALVDKLATFRPTHIAVEIQGKDQDWLDARYQNYRQGNSTLASLEVDQIGLRLAAGLGLDKVYAVDWNDNPPGYTDADFNWVEFAQNNDQESMLAAITDVERAMEFSPALAEQSMTAWFLQLNDPVNLSKAHQVYFDIASIGAGEQLVGANWVGSWYARNLKIIKRVKALSDDPDSRILLLYGQSHAYLLKQFAQESGWFELADVVQVLQE